MDFSFEKIVSVAAGLVAFGVLKFLGAPDWMPLVALVILCAWGPDMIKRIRS